MDSHGQQPNATTRDLPILWQDSHRIVIAKDAEKHHFLAHLSDRAGRISSGVAVIAAVLCLAAAVLWSALYPQNLDWLTMTGSVAREDVSYSEALARTNELIAIAAGDYHFLALDNAGVLWAWGNNEYGQIGDGTREERMVPVAVMRDVYAIYADENYSAALKADNSFWIWGDRSTGNKSNSTRVERLALTPEHVADSIVDCALNEPERNFILLRSDASILLLNEANDIRQLVVVDQELDERLSSLCAVDAVAGLLHALDTDGNLYAWHVDTEDVEVFSTLKTKAFLKNVAQIKAGPLFGLAVHYDGSMTRWEVPNVYAGVSSIACQDEITVTPLQGKMRSIQKIVSSNDFNSHIEMENVHFFLSTDHKLWGSGLDTYGLLSKQSIYLRYDQPIELWDNVLDVALGRESALVLRRDGSLWRWGSTVYFPLAGMPHSQEVPVKVMEQVASVAAEGRPGYEGFRSTEVSFAVQQDGALWSWGYNDFGALGDGSTISRGNPQKIMDSVYSIELSVNTSLILKKDGSLWQKNCKILDDVVQAAAGDHHYLALRRDGTVWGWGSNSAGGLGLGESVHEVAYPRQIIESVKYIAAGGEQSLVIKTDGSLWGWGCNTPQSIDDSVVGVGYIERSAVPIRIFSSGVTRATVGKRIKGYQGFALVLMEDGSLWGWGDNWNHQLGVDVEHSNILGVVQRPVKIMDNTIEMAAGCLDAMAIKNDGSLWIWGGKHQLPQKKMDNVKTAAMGATHYLAVKNDGSLWTWGTNYHGELGNGEMILQSIPQNFSFFD